MKNTLEKMEKDKEK